MLSFKQFNEELLQQVNLQKSLSQSGVDPSVFKQAKAVIGINDFLENPPKEAVGAYALGLSNSSTDIYFRIAKAMRMIEWPRAYKQVFGAAWWQKTNNTDLTDKFLDSIIQNDRTIVFFLPNNALQKFDKWRYTREELEYFLRNPEKLSKVIFVLGTYDMIDPKDYERLVGTDKKGFPRDLNDQDLLMHTVLRNPKMHRKP